MNKSTLLKQNTHTHTKTQMLSTKKTIDGMTKEFTDLIQSISSDTMFHKI